MAVERSRKGAPQPELLLPPTSPKVRDQRQRYYQLWNELENSQLSSAQIVDKNSEIMWLEVSLGYFTPIEGQARLLTYYDEVEKNDPSGDEYLNSKIERPDGSLIDRTIEIRNRVMTKDQFTKLSSGTKLELIREVMKIIDQEQKQKQSQ